MGVMLSSKGYGEWARIVAIVFTLAGMVVGFTMFAAGIRSRFFPPPE